MNTKWKPPCDLRVLEDHGMLPDSLDEGSRRILETFFLPEDMLLDQDQERSSDQPSSSVQSAPEQTTKEQGSLALHHLLEVLDPAEAARWHWRDTRKVRRSLERWWESRAEHVAQGERKSSPTSETPEHDPDDGKARFRTLIFWVYDPPEILYERLDRRVDSMIQKGLIQEILGLRRQAELIYGAENRASHEEGIFQSIGYKEFASIPSSELSPDHPLFEPAVERMRLSTRQYAKKQLKWIKKQLLPAVKKARSQGGEIYVYVLKAGDSKDGRSLLEAFTRRDAMPEPETVCNEGHEGLLDALKLATVNASIVPNIVERQSLNARRDCPVCSRPHNPVSIGIAEWDQHVKSRGHRRAAAKAELPEGSKYLHTGSKRKARRKALMQKAGSDAASQSSMDDDQPLGLFDI